MTLRLALLLAWLVLVALPVGLWWWWRRRSVDIFANLPVPAALLGSDGAVRQRLAGWPEADLDPDSLPAPGQTGRTLADDGTPLALRGVAGGALAVAVEADPGLAHRHRRLTTLVPMLQHEVRSGLQGVLGALALLEDDVPTPPAQRALAAARREAGRLIDLVDGAELLVRVGARAPTRTVIPAATLVSEAVEGLEEVVSTLLPDLGVLVEVCEWQLNRTLRNLIENGLRHGLPPVRVEVSADQRTVCFSVCDQGPGIEADQLDRLCAPFTRGVGAGPGSGLGLSVAAEVLAGHGSALRAQSGGLTFTLPRFRL
ncbi:MAG: sensor histidine kinase [Mycobacteriales bacterium]